MQQQLQLEKEVRICERQLCRHQKRKGEELLQVLELRFCGEGRGEAALALQPMKVPCGAYTLPVECVRAGGSPEEAVTPMESL